MIILSRFSTLQKIRKIRKNRNVAIDFKLNFKSWLQYRKIGVKNNACKYDHIDRTFVGIIFFSIEKTTECSSSFFFFKTWNVKIKGQIEVLENSSRSEIKLNLNF